MRLICCLTFFTLLTTRAAVAQISPGPLSKAHADLEGISNCTQCHESGKEISGAKCLMCHGEIGNQIKSKRGFHFANAASSCIACHKEHLGAEAKTTRFEESQFDHGTTGFQLVDTHKTIKCEQCHQSKNIRNPDVVKILDAHPHKTFLGLNPQCVSCHPDRHHGTVGVHCETCHGTKSWKPAATFDHAKAKFALLGKHKIVDCSKCHSGLAKISQAEPVLFSTKSFEDCTPCHVSPHGKTFSDKSCRSCHTAEGWSIVASFDHSTTRFPLVGSHAKVSCEKCHTEMNSKKGGTVSFVTKKFEDCTPCHSSPHSDKFSGRQCTSCHSSTSWNVLTVASFDHSMTGYELAGKHAEVKCEQCHKPSIQGGYAKQFRLAHNRCNDCHSDYHNGQFNERYESNCAICHTVLGYKPSTFSFAKHNETRFSLSGAHMAVPCESCHRKEGQKDLVFHFAAFRCETCHIDFHKGQFASQMVEHSCAQCHSTTEWKMTAFDHSKTRFPLAGKHASVKCADCHKERVIHGVNSAQYVGLPTDCQSCHDDIHQSQFRVNGQTVCATCHSPKGWHSLLFNHETQSSFHLTGAHKNVACGGCHKEEKSESKTFIRYKPLASRCESCHVGGK